MSDAQKQVECSSTTTAAIIEQDKKDGKKEKDQKDDKEKDGKKEKEQKDDKEVEGLEATQESQEAAGSLGRVPRSTVEPGAPEDAPPTVEALEGQLESKWAPRGPSGTFAVRKKRDAHIMQCTECACNAQNARAESANPPRPLRQTRIPSTAVSPPPRPSCPALA